MKSAPGRGYWRERRAESALRELVSPPYNHARDFRRPLMRTMPGFHRPDRKAAIADRLSFQSDTSRNLLRGQRAEDDAGEDADQHIVVADADPLLAAAGTAQAIAAIVADRPVLPPAGIFLAIAPVVPLHHDLLHE